MLIQLRAMVEKQAVDLGSISAYWKFKAVALPGLSEHPKLVANIASFVAPTSLESLKSAGSQWQDFVQVDSFPPRSMSVQAQYGGAFRVGAGQLYTSAFIARWTRYCEQTKGGSKGSRDIFHVLD